MPLIHCNKCHHEWEGAAQGRCGWCNSDGYILEEKASLERWAEAQFPKRKEKLNETQMPTLLQS